MANLEEVGTIKRIIRWEDGDELLAQAADWAEKYDKAREKEKEGAAEKDEAKKKLQAYIGVAALTVHIDPSQVDVLECGMVGDKMRIFRKSVTKGRSTISAEKLLELGVSANIIEAATVTGDPVTSWTVADVKPNQIKK